MRWLPILILLTACSTGYMPAGNKKDQSAMVEDVQFGNYNAGFLVSGRKGKDSLRLYVNMHLTPSYADTGRHQESIHIDFKDAGNNPAKYRLRKLDGPLYSPYFKGENWVYYFYSSPARHFPRTLRMNMSVPAEENGHHINIVKTFMLKRYHRVHFLS
jgi:hypothetical protein